MDDYGWRRLCEDHRKMTGYLWIQLVVSVAAAILTVCVLGYQQSQIDGLRDDVVNLKKQVVDLRLLWPLQRDADGRMRRLEKHRDGLDAAVLYLGNRVSKLEAAR